MKDSRTSYMILKRAFDLLISITGLIILSPFLLIISFFIFSNDSGPVFYKANRIGYLGRQFRMYKFRTMVIDADKKGPSSATSSDHRITGIGKFLRKYKLDEMPQLLNVLTGEMSMVGPRPEEKKFTDLFNAHEKMILSVKPGITDWASLWNSNEGEILEGSDDPDLTYFQLIRPEKIQLQIKYVNECNFLIDLKIFFLTVRKIFIRR